MKSNQFPPDYDLPILSGKRYPKLLHPNPATDTHKSKPMTPSPAPVGVIGLSICHLSCLRALPGALSQWSLSAWGGGLGLSASRAAGHRSPLSLCPNWITEVVVTHGGQSILLTSLGPVHPPPPRIPA